VPIPKPKRMETASDYIRRFMRNKRMQSEFKDRNQRLAVAYAQLRRRKRDGNNHR